MQVLLGAALMIERRKKCHDPDHRENGSDDADDQNDGRRLVFAFVALAHIACAQARHPLVDQNQKQRHAEIPAHQHPGEHSPMRGEHKEHNRAHQHGNQQPGVASEVFEQLA